MQVLIADTLEAAGVEALRSLGCSVLYEPGLGTDGLAARLGKGGIDVLIVRSTKVQAPVLKAAKGLRAIVRAGAGVDNIDVAAATACGVGVCNCPGMNAVAVAELAMGLLIACDRRIPDQTAELKAGRWNKKEFTTKARGLKGAHLLIVGFGSIGRAVARRAAAFEMQVSVWDAFLSAATVRAEGVRFAGSAREELIAALPMADAVSVHLALVPQTARFCNAEFFGAMKAGATFINTSRGGIVDEAAMLAAATAKGLRLGLDVHEGQPASSPAAFTTPTASFPASVLTHHCGASTDQAQRAVAEETVRIVQVFMATGRLENCVNESALPVVQTAAPQSAATPRR